MSGIIVRDAPRRARCRVPAPDLAPGERPGGFVPPDDPPVVPQDRLDPLGVVFALVAAISLTIYFVVGERQVARVAEVEQAVDPFAA